MSKQGFADKSVLVTGAAGGIGRAAALALAREGARVAVVDVDAAGGKDTVGLITQSGAEAFFTRAENIAVGTGRGNDCSQTGL